MRSLSQLNIVKRGSVFGFQEGHTANPRKREKNEKDYSGAKASGRNRRIEQQSRSMDSAMALV